jgi:hypothetical protein
MPSPWRSERILSLHKMAALRLTFHPPITRMDEATSYATPLIGCLPPDRTKSSSRPCERVLPKRLVGAL